MRLFHGTRYSALPSILKDGLVATRRKYVYFEDSFEGAQHWTTEIKIPMILEFEIPTALLVKAVRGEALTHYLVVDRVDPKYLVGIWIWSNEQIMWVNIGGRYK